MACYKRNISSSKTAIVIKSKQYRCYSMNTAGVFFPTPFQAQAPTATNWSPLWNIQQL